MTTVSNVGGGDSLQLGGRKANLKAGKMGPGKGSRYLTTGARPALGASYGEHSADRRERLRRITERAR